MKNVWIEYGVPKNCHNMYCKKKTNPVISSRQSSALSRDLTQPIVCSWFFLKPIKHGGGTMFPAQSFGISQLSSFDPLSQGPQTVLTKHRYVKLPKQSALLFKWLTVELCQVACWGLYDMLLMFWESMGSGTMDRNFCLFDGRGRYGLLWWKGWIMLLQRSGSQAVACRHHCALKLGLRAKYKLAAAHHLLSSFTHSQVTGLWLNQ